MRQSLNKVAPKRIGSAHRSPSPDISVRHFLKQTNPIHGGVMKKINEEMKQFKQQSFYANLSRQSIKDKVLYTDSYKMKRQPQPRMNQSSKNNGSDTKNKKLNLTLNDQHSSTYRLSMNKPRPTTFQQQRQNQIKGLKQKIKIITNENEQLRKQLRFRNSSPLNCEKNNSELSRVRFEVMHRLEQKMSRFEEHVIARIEELKQQSKRHEVTFQEIKFEKQLLENSRNARNPGSPNTNPQSIIKNRNQSKYSTPLHVNNKFDDEDLPLNTNVESEKIIQLQKQNQDLTLLNYQYKKAYDDLIKNQEQVHVTSFNDNSFRKSSGGADKMRESMTQVQDLRKQNQELRIKNQGLQRSFIEMKRNLDKSVRLTESIEQSPNHDYSTVLQQKDQEIKRLKKIINKELSSIQNSNNGHFYDQINEVSQQNYRLKEEIHNLTSRSRAQSQSNSQVQYQQKKISDLLNRNAQLERQVLSIRNQGSDYMDKMMQIKNQEIARLRQELNFSKSSQANNNQQLSNEIYQLRSSIQQANQKIQSYERINFINKQELQQSLGNLEQIKYLVDNIKFEQVEGGLKELANKYKALVNQKIEILKDLNNKTYEIHRLNVENDRNKLAAVENSMKYTNEKHNNERIEATLEQQRREVESLNQQIGNLNAIIKQYMGKQSAQRIVTEASESSRIRQLDLFLADQQTEKSVEELKLLQKQFFVVSSRVNDIVRKISHNLNGSRLSNSRSRYQ